MILIDTSIWIKLLTITSRKKQITEELLLSVVICPPVIQEILQGIRDDYIHTTLKERLMALPRVGDPLLLEDFLKAAQIYRIGRQKGYAIRSSIDCLIATIAIRENLSVWHQDRDFDLIAKFTELKIYK